MDDGLGSRAEVSVGWLSLGSIVPDADPLGILNNDRLWWDPLADNVDVGVECSSLLREY